MIILGLVIDPEPTLIAAISSKWPRISFRLIHGPGKIVECQ